MIFLDSVQILTALQNSLRAHVLPELDDEFACVQVHAALKALDEVKDRLTRGDPCERMNGRIEQGVREIAESLRVDSPELSSALDAALAAQPESDEPRDRTRQLGDALWKLISESGDPAAERLLDLLRQEALEVSSEDGFWICGESIASLT